MSGDSLLREEKRPTRTEALHGNRSCVLFQLHAILFRGSCPGLYSFHCYPFMTAPARLANDVCFTSTAEINRFTRTWFPWIKAQTLHRKSFTVFIFSLDEKWYRPTSMRDLEMLQKIWRWRKCYKPASPSGGELQLLPDFELLTTWKHGKWH